MKIAKMSKIKDENSIFTNLGSSSSFSIALFLINATLCANRHVEIDS